MDEKKYPYIYIDLDETLIYSMVFSTEPKNIQDGALKFKMGDYWYITQLRDCAKDLIKTCRRFSIVKILTAASRPYAQIISDHFELGFEHDDIVDRYQYCEFIRDGWSGYGGGARETCVALESVGHINSILVDNQKPDLPNARIKREWLGITEERYIQFPEWEGGPEDPNFNEEYEKIIKAILVLVTDARI